ncbi:MAG: tetratricopeptide repeat protein [Coriobacteriia bacterium]|nr:tetratricopeptide repeat protein [Coriobacteriia bacterium]
MRLPSDIRWLDTAIKGILLVVILAFAYLAYTIVAFQLQERRAQPASRAIENLIAAVADDPQNLGLRLQLAEAFAADGRLREAVEQFNAALEIEPDNPNALSGLALISMYQKQWDTAEEYWRAAIDELSGGEYSLLDQRLERAFYQLGVTLVEQKRYEEAVQYLSEALRMRRTSADTHYMLAYASRELGSATNQRRHLEDALRFDPRMPEAHYDLGLVLLAEGDAAGAAEHFRSSAEYAPPGHSEPLDELAKLEREADAQERLAEARNLARSDAEAALTGARIARALEPDDVEIAQFVAELYERTGDRDAALEAWRRVLELAPNDDDAAAAVDRLKTQE